VSDDTKGIGVHFLRGVWFTPVSQSTDTQKIHKVQRRLTSLRKTEAALLISLGEQLASHL
jgi:hypothetical protein